MNSFDGFKTLYFITVSKKKKVRPFKDTLGILGTLDIPQCSHDSAAGMVNTLL